MKLINLIIKVASKFGIWIEYTNLNPKLQRALCVVSIIVMSRWRGWAIIVFNHQFRIAFEFKRYKYRQAQWEDPRYKAINDKNINIVKSLLKSTS